MEWMKRKIGGILEELVEIRAMQGNPEAQMGALDQDFMNIFQISLELHY